MFFYFHNVQEAALFALEMKERGHFARIMDVHSAHLYFPRLTGGYKVWVSSTAYPEVEDMVEHEEEAVRSLRGTSLVAPALLATAIGVGGLGAVVAFFKAVQADPEFLRMALAVLAFSAAILAAPVLLSPFLAGLCTRYWRRDHPGHQVGAVIFGGALFLLVLIEVGGPLFWLAVELRYRLAGY